MPEQCFSREDHESIDGEQRTQGVSRDTRTFFENFVSDIKRKSWKFEDMKNVNLNGMLNVGE